MATSSMNIEIRHKGNTPQRKLNTDVINMSTDVNKSASSILAPLQYDCTVDSLHGCVLNTLVLWLMG